MFFSTDRFIPASKLAKALLLIPLLILSSCSPTLSQSPQEVSYDRGRNVYTSHCILCHGSDIHKDGPVGPSLYGSSYDLLLHKVYYGSYPDNYTPKRKTNLMPLPPIVRKDIIDLYYYLNEITPRKN